MNNGTTKKALNSSWLAAERQGQQTGTIPLNGASAAGFLLEIFKGDATAALRACPVSEALVPCRKYLHDIRDNEAPVAVTFKLTRVK